MSYEIVFETGSLKGKRWSLPEGGVLTIGRSHSCGVRPKEPDVSGKHAILREEGGLVFLEVLSAHKTAVGGIRMPTGKKVELKENSHVAIGGTVTFRVVLAGEGNETGEIQPGDTATLGGGTATFGAGTGTLATAATRAMPGETSMLGGETATLGARTATFGAGTGTLATAATRAMPGETSMLGGETATLGARTATIGATQATVATRAAVSGQFPFGFLKAKGKGCAEASDTREDFETSILPRGDHPGAGGVETAELDSEGGETQMLATQMASREELDKLKAAYEQKQARKTAKKTILLGIAVAAAVGVSIWFSSREPEKYLSMEGKRKAIRLVPVLLSSQKDLPGGVIGISLPEEIKPHKNADGVFEARVPVGKKKDVVVDVVFEAYSDPEALREPRAKTFDRYLENSEAMLSAMDEMHDLPEEDFFGGNKGLRRGIPCSRREYYCGRKGKSIYGVISFFRCGTLCFAFRREIAAYEQTRALPLMQGTSKWLYADKSGEFAARQWEGAEGAGCSSPAAEIARCEERLRVDSTSDWPMIEAGLRNVLVAVEGRHEDATLRERALGLLGELRKTKATHWQKLAARRLPLPNKPSGQSSAVAVEVGEIDALVRKDFADPSEEWYFLARRKDWWK